MLPCVRTVPEGGSTMDRRRFIRTSFVVAGGLAMRGLVTGERSRWAFAADAPYRAFSDASEWNRPLPADAPIDPASAAFVHHLKRIDPTVTSPRLVDGRWAEPVYWATTGDPEYRIDPFPFPVRIPAHAQPAPTSDAQLTVFDVERGYVIKLQKASFSGVSWTARWTELYYLASNGLFGKLPEADDRRNRG